MNKLLSKALKAVSLLALCIAIVDVNTMCCFAIFHQPKLPKSADKLKLK